MANGEKKNGKNGRAAPSVVADPNDETKRPNDTEKAISVAYIRLLGGTQKQAAKGAGCGVRTIGIWEKCSWWPDMQAVARQRWLQGVQTKAMKGIVRALSDKKEYAAMTKYIADRMIPECKPPRVGIDADVTANVTATADVHCYIPDNGRNPDDDSGD